MCIPVNGQSAAESMDKNNRLPASTEIVPDETFSGFLVAQCLDWPGQQSNILSVIFFLQAPVFSSLFFNLRSLIVAMEEGISSLFLVEDVW